MTATVTNLSDHRPGPSGLMTPGEVARVFRVGPRTVTRWANQGKLRAIRRAGGHRRFYRADRRAAARPVMTGTISDRDRMRANRAAIRQVPCPTCHAPRWEACVQPSGRKTPHSHPARRHAAVEAGVYVPGGAP